MKELTGYIRQDGRVGFRNHVLVLPTVSCSAKVAQKIAYSVVGCTVAHHNEGCGHLGDDYTQVMRTLKNTATHPNVAAVLLVGLGCEKTSPFELIEEIQKSGKRAEMLLIQNKGINTAIADGIEISKMLVAEAATLKRQKVTLEDITLGVECGGSDFSSGLAANPVVGKVADLIVRKKGSVILSEITELIGAEGLFDRRMRDAFVKKKFIEKLKIMEEESRKNHRAYVDGLDMPNCISPGNVRGGLTTLEEKALGAAIKGGSTTVVDVLNYAEQIKLKGLNIMHSPGYDIESVVGMVASGANIVIFTSGAGTPTGNPIVPVLKVTGNEETYIKMKDCFDFSVAGVLKGESITDNANKLLDLLIDVANGRSCKAEINQQDDYSIWNIGMKL